MARTFTDARRSESPHALSTDPFDLGGDPDKLTAPSEFRIFRAGVNTSSKGDFLFDDKAAESVMRAFREKGATLTMDYEHQALAYPPVKALASASSWVPEVRGGELWATRVHWTDEAKNEIEKRQYTRFSPAFVTEPTSNRITKIINCALTNTEALNHTEPLVAATHAHHIHEGDPMKKCNVCSEEIKDDEDVMHAGHANKGGMLSALSVMGLKADAGETKLIEALGEVNGFRSAVFAITGKREPGEALAILNAWKSNGEQIVTLTARIAEQATVTLRAQAVSLVTAAVEAGKIAPKGREMSKIVDDEVAPYVALRDGKFDDKVIAALTANLGARDAIVSTTKTKEAEGGAVALTADDKAMALSMGVSEDDMRAMKVTGKLAQAAAAK